MSPTNVPLITLHDGYQIPQLGFGTWQIDDNDAAARAVSTALEVGYRHIDTAAIYKNERGVGRGIAESGIPRDELFITTKLWNDRQGENEPLAAIDESLEKLGLEAADLYLVHWPVPAKRTAVTAWRGLVEIVGSAQCDSIGVSNFEIAHLSELLHETGVVPAVNQVELHPLHQRRELREFCAERGIAIEAWGPLSQGKSDLLERPEVASAAVAHGKTAAQVVIRWHLQHGTIVFPKTSSRSRLIENANVFDFELSADQMAAIDSLDRQQNFGPDPSSFNG